MSMQGWSSGTTNVTYTYTDNTTETVVPMQVYPAMVAMPAETPPEKDDSPLAWLRGQVAEMCELARAA